MSEAAGRGPIFFERALGAAAKLADPNRIWMELGIPALEGFLSGGHTLEAVEALHRLEVLIGPPEAAIAASPAGVIAAIALRIAGTARLNDNPDQAAANFERALSLSSDLPPEEWAAIQYGLGLAATDVYHSIPCFENAMRVYAQPGFESERTRTQEQLDRAYRELRVDDPLRIRKRYLDSLIRQHRYLRFTGMAEVSGPDMVEMARVFVLPRVVEANGEPLSSAQLLSAPEAPSRIVILGGPGSGKTTLLEALALGLAQPASFEWARSFPRLLPIFYRIRELDQDLDLYGGDLWACLEHRCGKRLGEPLPPGSSSSKWPKLGSQCCSMVSMKQAPPQGETRSRT
jgi:hypothetical protein